MHKTRVYLAKSNDARLQDVSAVRSYLRLHDVEIVEHDASKFYSNGPLLSSDYLVIIPAYNLEAEGKAAQKHRDRGIWTSSYKIAIGKGLATQIDNFDRNKYGLTNVYVYTGKNLQFRKINSVCSINKGTDWKDYAYIVPSADTMKLEFLQEDVSVNTCDFTIKLTGNLGQFCAPTVDTYRTIDKAVITYKGKSRIDNAPLFNIKLDLKLTPRLAISAENAIKNILTNWRFAQWGGCVSGSFKFLEAEVDESMYNVESSTAIKAAAQTSKISLQEAIEQTGPRRSAVTPDIISVQPMSKPSESLHYIDFVYENNYRLLLAE